MAIREDELRVLWFSKTTRQLAAQFGCDQQAVYRSAMRLGLPKKRTLSIDPEECYLPTREEIEKKCREFRDKWSDEERASRAVGHAAKLSLGWKPPLVCPV